MNRCRIVEIKRRKTASQSPALTLQSHKRATLLAGQPLKICRHPIALFKQSLHFTMALVGLVFLGLNPFAYLTRGLVFPVSQSLIRKGRFDWQRVGQGAWPTAHFFLRVPEKMS